MRALISERGYSDARTQKGPQEDLSPEVMKERREMKDKLIKDFKQPRKFLRDMRARIAKRPKRRFGSKRT